jgi:hypothetical protein
MQARYYAPELRRFISADTIVPDPGASVGYNRFAYANQNPVRFTDPSGFFSEDEISEYFGYLSPDEMLVDGWNEDLVWWLFDEDTYWGDVFGYAGGEAMVVLFEVRTANRSTYRGGFYGLSGDDFGLEVEQESIDDFKANTRETHALEEQDRLQRYNELPVRYDSAMNPFNDPATFKRVRGSAVVSTAATAVGGAACIAAGIPTAGWASASCAASDWFHEEIPVILRPRLNDPYYDYGWRDMGWVWGVRRPIGTYR